MIENAGWHIDVWKESIGEAEFTTKGNTNFVKEKRKFFYATAYCSKPEQISVERSIVSEIIPSGSLLMVNTPLKSL